MADKKIQWDDKPDTSALSRVQWDEPQQNSGKIVASMSSQPKWYSKEGLKSLGYTALDRLSNALPAAGGIAGGLIGGGTGAPSGPGALATGTLGAATGGALGEDARQMIRHGMGWDAPATVKDSLVAMGKEGLKQGAYELGGQVVGRIGKAAAPKLAETAMAPGKRLLKSVPEGVDIGNTVLNETNGIRPQTITKQLEAKITAHSQDADNLLSDAALKGKKVPLAPARQIVGDETTTAVSKNSPAYIRDVNKVADQLTNQYGPTGEVVSSLPSHVDPVKARSLRQGIDLSIGNWNPEAQAAIAPLQRRVYGAISGEIHKAVPEVAAHDAAMTSLIPAKDAAWNVSYNPSITRNVFNRIARPTGALAGAGFGAYEGQKNGGTLGGIAGGALGLVAPELIASPTGQMFIARSLNSRAVPIVASNTPRVVDWAMKPTAEEEEKKRLTGDQ